MSPALLWGILVYQWVTIHFSLVDASSQCYFPNGAEAEGWSACNPDADVSFCCSFQYDYTCYNNLLCQDGKGRVVRGACTDQSWTDPACPQYCQNYKLGGTDLIPCNNVTKDHISYCCDHAIDNCCDTGDGRFDVLPYPTSLIATWNPAASEYEVLPGASATASSTSPSLSSSSVSTTTTSSSTASTVSNSSNNDSGLSKGAQIGIGVGVAGGVLLAALLAYLLWRVHKMHEAVKQQHDLNSRTYPPSTMTDTDFSQSYPQPWQYKNTGISQATQAQLVAESELSTETRRYELHTTSR
ncbi:hypothetical protein F5B22DRAFT_384810 [Xylaria bambusicola]|uniref:uncharacterized protein n=1 Tax=Xylaria bambusicola TaxID=326684 RepID=UPI002008623C|nr:uncharacterized protein F5B22DRAFT_384810 [Xylaria bambusicola]KAI0508800.1 hypothetical protein F5B22DRAFT_384810 [Xylaria bambusicola]